MLDELASLDSNSALRHRLRHYVAPTLLVIDEVGYLSYSNRHADLMFELIRDDTGGIGEDLTPMLRDISK